MKSTAQLASASRKRLRGAALTSGVLAVAISSTFFGSVASAATKPPAGDKASGTVVMAATGAYGPMLIVGSGPGVGTAVYAISSDYGTHFGCTTKVVTFLGTQKAQCTGPESDEHAEWPALTTTAPPVAGPGINAKLLGEVNRAGIGEQVTYGGHPLYLFDSTPGILSGEGWDEATLPPWHGLWNLVSPLGGFAAPAQTLTTTETTGGKTVLAAVMTAGGGSFAFPVYTLSGASSCSGACIESWPPLLTSGSPGLLNRLKRSKVGSVKIAKDTYQVTYGGKPLYLYGYENISLAPGHLPTPAGNGNGVAAPSPAKGTFELVTP